MRPIRLDSLFGQPSCFRFCGELLSKQIGKTVIETNGKGPLSLPKTFAFVSHSGKLIKANAIECGSLCDHAPTSLTTGDAELWHWTTVHGFLLYGSNPLSVVAVGGCL